MKEEAQQDARREAFKLDQRIEPDKLARHRCTAENVEPGVGNKDEQCTKTEERPSVEIFYDPRGKKVELLLHGDAPQRVNRVDERAMRGELPGSHKDDKPAYLDNFGLLIAGQQSENHAEGQTKVIERPYPQDSANIELFHVNRAGGFTFAKQQLADKEGTEGEEEAEAEAARAGSSIEDWSKDFQDAIITDIWESGQVVVQKYEHKCEKANDIQLRAIEPACARPWGLHGNVSSLSCSR